MSITMRKIWMGVAASVAILSFFPAWTGATSWWMPGIAFTVFAVFLLEPLVLTWEIRKRGEELQITDEGVLRKLARGDSEFVRWSDLREVSIAVTQGANLGEEYVFVLAGTGTSGVLIGQRLATRHDLVSHLIKLPGFDHRRIDEAISSPVNQRVLLWRAAPIQGEAQVVPLHALPQERQRLH
ncbi:MAG: hypothetical protein H7Y89_10200 [Steroidobacteraceae bacterium]|nr:hypothetical protein [Steroidobacteraceae bacterium]